MYSYTIFAKFKKRQNEVISVRARKIGIVGKNIIRKHHTLKKALRILILHRKEVEEKRDFKNKRHET